MAGSAAPARAASAVGMRLEVATAALAAVTVAVVVMARLAPCIHAAKALSESDAMRKPILTNKEHHRCHAAGSFDRMVALMERTRDRSSDDEQITRGKRLTGS